MSLLAQTRRISLELSNSCNLASLHRDCPASVQAVTRRLSTEIVSDVIEYAGREMFSGVFAWHIYNEPLMDERIVSFCQAVRDACPSSKGSIIWTNGDYLNENLLEELLATRIYKIRVSLYTVKAMQRMRDLALKYPDAPWAFSSYIQGFDDRMRQYEARITEPGKAKPCWAPLNDLTINSAGEIVLCCQDWRWTVKYGTLGGANTFERVLSAAHKRMSRAQSQLVGGHRLYEVCMSCTREREEHPEEVNGIPTVPSDPERDALGKSFDPRL